MDPWPLVQKHAEEKAKRLEVLPLIPKKRFYTSLSLQIYQQLA